MDNQGRAISNPSGYGGFSERPEDAELGRVRARDGRNSITHNYRQYLKQPINKLKKIDTSALTLAQSIALKSALKAQNDLGYLKEVTDRTEGKAVQQVATVGKQEFTVSFIKSS